jgi:hypothetical protein
MRGRPFEPGNKMGRGRPPGSRNKRTFFIEAMEKHGLTLIQQCQAQAFKGDSTALRLCIERLLPPCKPPSSRFRLPPVGTAEDLVRALPAVMQAVARGRLSAQEGAALASMLDSQRRAIETQDFEARVRALEQATADNPSRSDAPQCTSDSSRGGENQNKEASPPSNASEESAGYGQSSSGELSTPSGVEMAHRPKEDESPTGSSNASRQEPGGPP